MMIDKQTKKSYLTESKNFAANLFLKKIHNSMMVCKLELKERRYGNSNRVDNTHNKLVISPQ